MFVVEEAMAGSHRTETFTQEPKHLLFQSTKRKNIVETMKLCECTSKALHGRHGQEAQKVHLQDHFLLFFLTYQGKILRRLPPE